MATDEALRRQARLAIVDEHVRCENSHDLDALMATFGTGARYDDEPWNDRRVGHDDVRSYYGDLLNAMPDLSIEVTQRHVAADSVILEVMIRGTHRGAWRGLPATGRRIEFPLCGVFSFDENDRLAGERIYYDRGAVLGQLGLFHEPLRGWGRIVTALSHPITIARAYLRRGAWK